MKKAFTLIELLVVVLIIGILAAVALPQYQKAVLKSRAAGLVTNMGTLYNALEAYAIENGNYPPLTSGSQTMNSMNSMLSVDIPFNKNVNKYYYYTGVYVAMEYDDGTTQFYISKGLSDTSTARPFYRKGVTSCWAYDRTDPKCIKGQELCRSLCSGTLNQTGDVEANSSIYDCQLK